MQGLALRNVARIEQITGQYVIRATASGGFHWYFTTGDDRHGWLFRPTGEWGWGDPTTFTGHTTMCRILFHGSTEFGKSRAELVVMCPDGRERVHQEGSRIPQTWPEIPTTQEKSS